MNVRPVGTTIGRAPNAQVVGRRVNHAGMGGIDCNIRRTASRPEARVEALSRLAADYYSVYPDEIDSRIREDEEAATRLQELLGVPEGE